MVQPNGLYYMTQERCVVRTGKNTHTHTHKHVVEYLLLLDAVRNIFNRTSVQTEPTVKFP